MRISGLSFSTILYIIIFRKINELIDKEINFGKYNFQWIRNNIMWTVCFFKWKPIEKYSCK